MTAYRDDLEAALRRADDLDREVAALRERNQKLAVELAGGDTAEATANARRLAAAVLREQAEQHRREEANLDERAARDYAKAARPWNQQASPGQRVAIVLYGVAMVLKIVVAIVGAVAAAAMRGHR